MLPAYFPVFVIRSPAEQAACDDNKFVKEEVRLAGSPSQKSDSQVRVERAGVPARLHRWMAANAQALGARSAIAMVRQGARSHVLVRWPDEAAVDRALAATVERALGEGALVERATPGDEEAVFASVPVRLGGRPGAVGFELDARALETSEALIGRIRDAVLRRTDDASATFVAPSAPTPVPDSHESESLVARQGAALELIAAVVDHGPLQRATRALVDVLATRFGCSRVTLGTRRLRNVRIQSVSGAADFDVRSSAMVAIARALRETIELGHALAVPNDDPGVPLPPEHRSLADYLKSPALLSLPLVDDGATRGALLFERDRAFSADEIEQIRQLVILSGPVLCLKQRDASGPVSKLLRAAQRQLAQWFGPDHLVAKGVLVALLGLTGWSAVHRQPLSVAAEAAIEAGVQRAVVAGANSYISQVEKRAGDVVYQGDVLARLDVEDLQLERLKWESEREKLAREQRATLAQRDRTRVRVLSAQRAQAQAQIEFLDAQIARAVLRAPIDGVVVAGDLSEALGSPVERGQLLFEVASLRDYRLTLSVDESDIGDIAEGYRGRLKLRSLPNDTFDFVVTRITPVSVSGDGRNAFRLEANFEQTPDALRPGMEGVARIDAGEHPIGVIWTRAFVRWARLQLWRLGVL